MKSFALACIAAVFATGCVGFEFGPGVQGSGKITSEERSVAGFSRVESRGAFDVDVKIGRTGKIKIEGDDNLLPLVESKVENGTLVLSSKENLRPTKGMRITVPAQRLDGFDLKGAGDVSLDGLNQDKFELKVHGAGDITGKGKVGDLKVQLHGAGDVKLYDVRANSVDAAIHGAGDVEVHASQRLNGAIHGAGSIRYRGNPGTVNREVKGVGKISAG